jgi:hypothetical protein
MLRHLLRTVALTAALTPLIFSATPASAKTGADRPVVEVAFVLDTTGSMAALIEGAKRKIWSIATAIIDCSPDAEIRMGLVAYRDIGDSYVTKTFDLTEDIQGLYADLLNFRAQGGGDWPESVNEALHTAVTKMSWTRGPVADRIVFLVGDAPAHMDYQQDMKYPDILRLARAQNITVNAVQAGTARDTERMWREIAQMGRGDYIPIPQSGGEMAIIVSPYDREILEMQGQINGTVIPYGPRQQQERVKARSQQYGAAPAAVASDMAGYMSKRRGGSVTSEMEAVTGGGDLVAEIGAGRQSASALKDDDLPDNLRKMSAAERQSYIDKQLTDRKALNQHMAELVKKRDTYVADQRKKAPGKSADSFDSAVETTLRAQIRR